ncbi:MAG: DNA polymerase I [Acidimicrobiia bacterium]|nr:DNA polymerase I [Acidimicrobiia bacterium]
MKRLALDGNSLAYRAFFALPEESLTTSDGQPTNAVYGFTNMLLRMLREREPDYVVVTFDAPTPQFRLDIEPQYKAQREARPPSLSSQMAILSELLEVLRVPILRVEGAEADDVLATLAREAKGAGIDVEIVTGDRDAFQVVDDAARVTVLYTRRGISEVDEMDEAAVRARFGVGPDHYVELAALRGDTSDNLPGVPGIGDKTAAKLLERYGGLDGIIAHVGELTPKQSENVAAHWGQVEKNVQVIRLVEDVDLGVGIEDLRIGEWDVDAIVKVYKTLEFGTILNRTLELAERYAPAGHVTAAEPVGVEVTHETVRSAEELRGAVAALARPLGVSAEIPARAGDRPTAWAVADGTGHAVVASADVADPDVLAEIMAGPGPSFDGYATKDLIAALAREGVDVRGLDVDTEIAAWMLDPAPGNYPLEGLAARYLGTEIESPDAGGQGTLALGGTAEADARLATRAWAAVALAENFRRRLETNEMWSLYEDVERPVTRILAKMEAAGIKVDVDYLETLSADLTQRIDALARQIWDHAGREFTINSTKQLREVLFEELGLTPQKKTKTGFSTDAATLESLRHDHPIVECLLEYRNLEKLRSTYTDALPPLVDRADGRIHTRFKQTGAATGRLSSENPNLMNIPIRTEEGRRIRRAFVPEAGSVLCSADYSQIELRVMAHLSGDEHLIDAFRAGQDIHAATAARVFGVGIDAVTGAHRNRAKVVNYGLLYGMQAWGMATRMGIDKAEAQEFIDAYFEQFPTLKAFMDRTVEQAKADGFTTTILGRRRWFDELRSRNPRFRQMGERQALNAPIQGSAADIMKVAMIDLDTALAERGMRSRLLLQVHDELVLEVPAGEEEETAAVVRDVMENAVPLAVPLVAEIHLGATWDECKG